MRFRHVAARRKGIPAPVRWSFILFVFTIPFEAADFSLVPGAAALGFLSQGRSLPKLCGLLFLATYGFYRNSLLKNRILPRLSAPLYWFMAYVLIFTLNGFLLVEEEFTRDFVVRFLMIGQLLGLFWIGSDLIKDAAFLKSVLVTCVIAATVSAVAVAFQIPGFHLQVADGRITSFADSNPNGLAQSIAIALVIIIGLYVNQHFRTFKRKLFFLALSLPLLIGIAKTGSRGGVVCLLLGCSIYLLPQLRVKRTMTAIAVAGLSIIAAVYLISKNPQFMERWRSAYQERDLAARENIYPVAVDMFLERPFLGWHVEAPSELGSRLGRDETDTHSLLLHLLTEGGLFGTIPFLVGFFLCGRAAWMARRGHFGLLPFALFSISVGISIAGNSALLKTFWLLLTISVAAPIAGVRQSRKAASPVRLRSTGANRMLVRPTYKPAN
jgi:O-antigen ligase